MSWTELELALEKRKLTVAPLVMFVDVALQATASVDAVPAAHPQVGWEQQRTAGKGRHPRSRHRHRRKRPGARAGSRRHSPICRVRAARGGDGGAAVARGQPAG
ncbi:hypothetical protein AB0C11_25860 [Streptomyces sp. NPDC039016]|uniref:hypothetical protein n=1 Tax=Streptomyces sp. NPDC039016 TaxID=3154330 RepID=UPI0033CAD10C